VLDLVALWNVQFQRREVVGIFRSVDLSAVSPVRCGTLILELWPTEFNHSPLQFARFLEAKRTGLLGLSFFFFCEKARTSF
jgi:hypothetical protein